VAVLLWKLFSDLSSGSIVDTTPSGMFPGGGVDPGRRDLLIAVEKTKDLIAFPFLGLGSFL
jgi:hypothetical protein